MRRALDPPAKAREQMAGLPEQLSWLRGFSHLQARTHPAPPVCQHQMPRCKHRNVSLFHLRWQETRLAPTLDPVPRGRPDGSVFQLVRDLYIGDEASAFDS